MSLGKWLKKNWWVAPLVFAAAPYALPALGIGGASAAGAGAAGAGAAGAGAGAAGAGIGVTGGLASGMSLAGPVTASAATLGSGGTFLGSLGNVAASNPKWMAFGKAVGAGGVQQWRQAQQDQQMQEQMRQQQWEQQMQEINNQQQQPYATGPASQSIQQALQSYWQRGY
jgi:hypothetical protein